MLKTEVKTASTADLVAFYNKHNKKQQIKKFADRATAEKRVAALIDEIEAAAAEAAKLAAAPALPARQGKVQVANGAVTLKTAAGATVRVVPAAGTKRPEGKAAKAKSPAHDADKTEYKLGDISSVKRGAIFEAVTKMQKRGGTFTRPDFCKACGGEVNSLSHFYWAKRHGVVVLA